MSLLVQEENEFFILTYRVGRIGVAVHGSGDNVGSKVNEKWELISAHVGRNASSPHTTEHFCFFFRNLDILQPRRIVSERRMNIASRVCVRSAHRL